MVIVEAVSLGFESVVISESPVMPVDALGLVDALPDVDDGLARYCLPHVGLYVHRVAWQVQLQVAVAEAEAVGIDQPLQCRSGGVDSSGVCEVDVDVGVFQSCAVHLSQFLVEVDTF